MVAPEVVVARLTITAPFCAAEVEMVGAAALVCVGVELAPLPPPHPHIKVPDKTIAASIAVSICIWRPQISQALHRMCSGERRSDCRPSPCGHTSHSVKCANRLNYRVKPFAAAWNFRLDYL